MLPGLALDRSSELPLYRQLTDALRDAILGGGLVSGARLPSSRDLQAQLGLSRNTVVDALEQLHAEGYLTTVHGIGTFVAAGIQLKPPASHARVRPDIAPSPTAAAAVEAEPQVANLHVSVPFRPGLPALDLFPAAAFRRGFDSRDWSVALLDYPDPLGDESLRAEIAARLRQTRGINVAAADIFITAGGQSALALIAAALISPGDRAIVEDPGYPNVRAALQTRGAALKTAPVDQDGVRVQTFARRSARLVYVTPSHQYPTGAVLSLDRRLELLAWAEKRGAWIVEDDYDAEFNYSGRTQPALFALAQGGRVIYAGTLSKVLSPALRVAYLVVPPELRRAFLAVHNVLGGPPDVLVQRALARFMRAGHLGRHIRAMRKVYDERRRFVADALAKAAPQVTIDDSRAGLHFVAYLPRGVDDRMVAVKAVRAGIIVPALRSYAAEQPVRPALVVGFAASSNTQAANAIAQLKPLLAKI